MALNKEIVLSKLKKEFPQADEKQLKEVSYNLALSSSITESNFLEFAAKALERLSKTTKQKSNLAVHADQLVTAKTKVCPICKIPMKLVKLMEDRDAAYCDSHRIVEPLAVS